MTLHTIIPLEAIWEGADKLDQPSEEVTIQGVLMQVNPLGNNEAQIVRLLGCPLGDYLNPAFAPGQIIHYIPTLKMDL
ncbi:YlzJ-like family protein [Paenibacillus pini]|uniref:YlzJ-like protein n=1 Tax=Paenibacillus pini JCM 16418 TaxID=1236976 RepID=W7YQQ7_9BACL|nr:YlzJ-like family protein [Paenibacillus pini]GAF09753.1 hypothetical protein JCM16418_3907 [Paenibacillus pini JCM 16418]